MRARTSSRSGASGWNGRRWRSADSTTARAISVATPARSSSSSSATASSEDGAAGRLRPAPRRARGPRCMPASARWRLDDDRLADARLDHRHVLDRADRAGEVGQLESPRSVRRTRRPPATAGIWRVLISLERGLHERLALGVGLQHQLGLGQLCPSPSPARPRSRPARRPSASGRPRGPRSTSCRRSPPTPPLSPWRWLRMTASGPSSSRICGASSSSDRPT